MTYSYGLKNINLKPLNNGFKNIRVQNERIDISITYNYF